MILSILNRMARWAEMFSLGLAGLATVYLLFVTAFNVATRALFDLSGTAVNLMIPAAIEQASYALLLLVFAALGAAARKNMIAVDLFVGRFPAVIRTGAARLWFLLIMVLAVVLAWSFGEEAIKLAGRGDVTQDLGLPLWTFYAAITVECLALAVICLAEGLTATEIGEGGAMT
ncbi:TRAP-type C4-dicarboxylate transport system, small permease component [Marinibacterium anthonyi]|nr:TRAP-type C4-dicarboxylate transport system, small permease component [Marinibacterium anthonyi]